MPTVSFHGQYTRDGVADRQLGWPEREMERRASHGEEVTRQRRQGLGVEMNLHTQINILT